MQTRQPAIVRRPVGSAPLSLPGIGDLLTRIYAARGVRSAAELDRSLAALPPPDRLAGTAQAAGIVADAIEREAHILVVGDYDCDGATSCALSMLALRAMGAARVGYLVPNRFRDGYGLTPEIVERALERSPDLLITVDNGITSCDGVRAAAEAGLPVVVTDHHLPGPTLPDAAALVNPRLPAAAEFPGQDLAGVGVVFYLLLALRAELDRRGWFKDRGGERPNLANYLDLVALGTVADVMSLDRVNRILVYQGLGRIRAGRTRPGIQALLQVAGRDSGQLVAADLGFAVAPRLNAAGRLDDISAGIECLLAEDEETAMRAAVALDQMNRERRKIEEQMQEQALEDLGRLRLGEEGAMPLGLCLFQPEWHQGVVGILASRIKERCHRPVIAFAADGAMNLRGSGRSISGLNIRNVLESIVARHPGMVSRFGGHAMAAGLTLSRERYGDFAAAFDAEVRSNLREEDLLDTILSDGPLEVEQLSQEVALALAQGGPWGKDFPQPLFDGIFQLDACRVLADRHLKMVLRSPCGEAEVDAIAFNQAEQSTLRVGERVHVAYRLEINTYRDRSNLQLLVEHIVSEAESGGGDPSG